MYDSEKRRSDWIAGLRDGMTRDPQSPLAVQRFQKYLRRGGPRADACRTLYDQASAELWDDGAFTSLRTMEERLLYLVDVEDRANEFACCLRQHSAYAAPPREGDHTKPAYHLQRSHWWFQTPPMEHLGAAALGLVLRSYTDMMGHADVVFVLPEGARLTEHHLAWLSTLNAALRRQRARLMRITWAHEGWKRGLGYREGLDLASPEGQVVQRLEDAASGQACELVLADEGGCPDGSRRYALALRELGGTPVAPSPDLWVPDAGTYALKPQGTVELLQVDGRMHRLVAKFEGTWHLLQYEPWARTWQVPTLARLTGESDYDRAYYLGQGCWECLQSLEAPLAEEILRNGWLGSAWTAPEGTIRILLPDGTQLDLDRETGRVRSSATSPYLNPRKATPMSRTRDLAQTFRSTKAILRQGAYQGREGMVALACTAAEHAEAHVLSAPEVIRLVESPQGGIPLSVGARCSVSVTDEDSLAAARHLAELPEVIRAKKPPLVLNFANPHTPGGGVERGARAQEEDLCRRSTLYASLTSPAAKAYYQENHATSSYLFAHNAILSPHVEVFRAADGSYLDRPFEVAVLTVAAPYAPRLGGVSKQELHACYRTRIMGMLQIAATNGYEDVVLGAWGCGAFENDPQAVATAFREAILAYRSGHQGDATRGVDYNSAFRRLRFAVPKGPNHDTFARVLADIHHDEDARELTRVERRRATREECLDRVQGCLLGGAVGDALGYPVEFMSYEEIVATFGDAGIGFYRLDRLDGTAHFSDDTQMTLFTVAGLLLCHTRASLRGIAGRPAHYVHRAYLDWLRTQNPLFRDNPHDSFLVDVPQLNARRAPGNTCLSALMSGKMGTPEKPLNESKGCGGVMRVAPVGLFARDVSEPWRHAAEVAAITHGHPLGYLPAAALARIVELCAFQKVDTLREAVKTCIAELPGWFPEQREANQSMADSLSYAMHLATNGQTRREADQANIVRLGEGWVGDEALAIAVYCCLRHPDSFDEAIIAAVNHGGDSDSTGAIAGNIMGAWLGVGAIGSAWTERLELRGLILELGRDLCDGCLMSEYGTYRDARWLAKYAPVSTPSIGVDELLRTMEG